MVNKTGILIEKRTKENIARVKNLINTYELMKNNNGQHDTDILRAAVVFLHATLEDCLRSIAYEKLPSASQSELNKIGEKISLGKVAEYRNKTVVELINDVAYAHLERKTYNNTTEIKSALNSFSIKVDDKIIKNMEIVMQRRHKIVHRADRGNKEDGEIGRITAIQSTHVSKWADDVELFVDSILISYQQSTEFS